MEKSFETLVRNSFLFAGQRAAGQGVSPDEWIDDPVAFEAAACGVMDVLNALVPKRSDQMDGGS